MLQTDALQMISRSIIFPMQWKNSRLNIKLHNALTAATTDILQPTANDTHDVPNAMRSIIPENA